MATLMIRMSDEAKARIAAAAAYQDVSLSDFGRIALADACDRVHKQMEREAKARRGMED